MKLSSHTSSCDVASVFIHSALFMGVLTFHCGASTVVGSISAALVHVTVTGDGETFTVQHAELDAELVRVSKRDEDAAAVDAAARGGCAADLRCGADHGGAVCPRGMTCRAAACVPTAHDDGGTLASLLGAEAFSENYGGACGRGLHSFTFQLNLSRVCHKKTPNTP